ncbi:uncharacterized protein [Aegilops tauschii subsp. strangulata]|uniref:uncharacterized protein n=1 Tax=Aegilops tauschii subsp. strangulata TaxID=200361 RepID=UPI003CC86A7E
MVLCIVETQIAKYRVEGLVGRLGFDSSFGVGSSGRSGGLCLYWKNNVNVEIKTFSQYHIDSVVTEPGKDPWRFSCFYGAANRSLRYKTWDTMKILRGESSLPWVCIGDFNEILRPEEQFGPNERDAAQIAGFREAVDVCELADLGYKGLDWTFEKRIVGGDYCRVRLDRALASPTWSAMFPFATLEHLTAAKSDHSPILLSTELDTSEVRLVLRKPFRYECMWEREPSFKTQIEQMWTEQQPATTTTMLSAKLNAVANQLKHWGRRTFGSVRQEMRELRTKLAALRAAPDRIGPSIEEKEVQDRMVELSYREEIMMRQRSRITWLSHGDNNTQYFQKKASARRARNRIVQLQRLDGSMSSDPEEMAGMATDFYKNLYTSEGTIGMEEVLSHIPVRVNGDMNNKLNAPYMNEEIKEALF